MDALTYALFKKAKGQGGSPSSSNTIVLEIEDPVDWTKLIQPLGNTSTVPSISVDIKSNYSMSELISKLQENNDTSIVLKTSYAAETEEETQYYDYYAATSFSIDDSAMSISLFFSDPHMGLQGVSLIGSVKRNRWILESEVRPLEDYTISVTLPDYSNSNPTLIPCYYEFNDGNGIWTIDHTYEEIVEIVRQPSFFGYEKVVLYSDWDRPRWPENQFILTNIDTTSKNLTFCCSKTGETYTITPDNRVKDSWTQGAGKFQYHWFWPYSANDLSDLSLSLPNINKFITPEATTAAQGGLLFIYVLTVWSKILWDYYDNDVQLISELTISLTDEIYDLVAIEITEDTDLIGNFIFKPRAGNTTLKFCNLNFTSDTLIEMVADATIKIENAATATSLVFEGKRNGDWGSNKTLYNVYNALRTGSRVGFYYKLSTLDETTGQTYSPVFFPFKVEYNDRFDYYGDGTKQSEEEDINLFNGEKLDATIKLYFYDDVDNTTFYMIYRYEDE
jgi:hypothetical protein